ncbi:hypothetical protein FB451DRAFT_1173424 [Mycena latifolia]|nr:hypothetical protein FB451DRAFT_1173424 [Mycena latifolia]
MAVSGWEKSVRHSSTHAKYANASLLIRRSSIRTEKAERERLAEQRAGWTARKRDKRNDDLATYDALAQDREEEQEEWRFSLAGGHALQEQIQLVQAELKLDKRRTDLSEEIKTLRAAVESEKQAWRDWVVQRGQIDVEMKVLRAGPLKGVQINRTRTITDQTDNIIPDTELGSPLQVPDMNDPNDEPEQELDEDMAQLDQTQLSCKVLGGSDDPVASSAPNYSASGSDYVLSLPPPPPPADQPTETSGPSRARRRKREPEVDPANEVEGKRSRTASRRARGEEILQDKIRYFVGVGSGPAHGPWVEQHTEERLRTRVVYWVAGGADVDDAASSWAEGDLVKYLNAVTLHSHSDFAACDPINNLIAANIALCLLVRPEEREIILFTAHARIKNISAREAGRGLRSPIHHGLKTPGKVNGPSLCPITFRENYLLVEYSWKGHIPPAKYDPAAEISPVAFSQLHFFPGYLRGAPHVAIETECTRFLKRTRLVKEITTQQLKRVEIVHPRGRAGTVKCHGKELNVDFLKDFKSEYRRTGHETEVKRGWVGGRKIKRQQSRCKGRHSSVKERAPTIDGCGGKSPEEPRALGFAVFFHPPSA